MSLQDSIARNRKRTARYVKAERILRRVRLRVFDYEDAGRMEQAQRVIKRCKAILTPLWEQQHRDAENRRTQNYMM